MRNIVLMCVAGMSTSMLEMKMRQEAEAQGYECTIQAYPLTDIKKIGMPDIVLLGPQVRFQLDKVKSEVSCPVVAVDMREYGTMDGAAVLKKVREALGD